MSHHSQATIGASHPGPDAAEAIAFALVDALLDQNEAAYGTPAYADARDRLARLAPLAASWRRLMNFRGPKTRAAVAVELAEADRRAGLKFRGYVITDDEHKAALADYQRFAQLYDDVVALIAAGYIREE